MLTQVQLKPNLPKFNADNRSDTTVDMQKGDADTTETTNDMQGSSDNTTSVGQ